MNRKAFTKTMSLIMCVLMMISTIGIVNVSAVEVFTSKDGKWKCMTLENGEASVIKYLGKATTVTLPEEIDGYKMDWTMQFFAFIFDKISISIALFAYLFLILHSKYVIFEVLDKIIFYDQKSLYFYFGKNTGSVFNTTFLVN